jgi:hypothetical protein
MIHVVNINLLMEFCGFYEQVFFNMVYPLLINYGESVYLKLVYDGAGD